ncbi:UNVERIFIED_ORG: hypothetical protein ABIC97_005532 [Peribacillus simplex]
MKKILVLCLSFMLILSSAPAFTKSVNAAEPSSTEEEVPNVNGDAVINTIEPYVYLKKMVPLH